MIRTVIGLAVAGFIFKRTAPDAYAKTVQAVSDVVDATSDIVTAVRGQCAAYTAEAAADASARLQKVDPDAVQKLRALLDGGQSQPAQPAAPRRVAPRHRP